MSEAGAWAGAVVLGYLLGSIPVAVAAGRSAGVDPRRAGDRNPGYWNARSLLSRRRAVVVFVGDAGKGALAAGAGQLLGGGWAAYAAAAAAMAGHAWPVFARFRGGRSVLVFCGAAAVICPWAAACSAGACLGVTVATGSFAYGARVGVFGFPLAQLAFAPPTRVAATGALMTFIGLRFLGAAVAARRTTPDSG